jgi:FkbM family methyltransferase
VTRRGGIVGRLRAALAAAPDAPEAEAARAAPDDPPAVDFLERDRLDTEHMRRLIAFMLGPDSNCIDVGAHRGSVLEQIVRVAPQGRHIAYEPLPHLAAELAEQFPGVDVRPAALSDHRGESTFAHVRAAEGWSGLRFRPLPGNAESEVTEISVRLEPLDEALDPDYVPAFIKVDVEGAERQVFEGALRTLRKHRPTLVFEHGLGSANAYGTEPDHIHELLAGQAGLRIFDLDGNGPYSLEEFRRTYYAAERVNFLAHR